MQCFCEIFNFKIVWVDCAEFKKNKDALKKMHPYFLYLTELLFFYRFQQHFHYLAS